MKKWIKSLVTAAFVFGAHSAGAVTLDVNGGILEGASNVNIGGVFYDVSFETGSCFSLFDGCDASNDLPFSTRSDAETAAQALLDQVFTGTFDTTPSTVFGCLVGNSACSSRVYYDTDGTIGTFIRARNIDTVNGDSVRSPLTRPIGGIVSAGDFENIAVFTRSALAPVPEPGLIFQLGLLALGLATGTRRRA